MKFKSLIDPKKRARAMEALRRNKPELLLQGKRKPKAGPEVEQPDHLAFAKSRCPKLADMGK